MTRCVFRGGYIRFDGFTNGLESYPWAKSRIRPPDFASALDTRNNEPRFFSQFPSAAERVGDKRDRLNVEALGGINESRNWQLIEAKGRSPFDISGTLQEIRLKSIYLYTIHYIGISRRLVVL